MTASRVRLEQTLYSEYPKLRVEIEKLRGAKTLHTKETLAEICGLELQVAAVLAQDLVDVGFFEQRGTREAPAFWIPFLYRDALDLVQGAAD